MKYGIILLTAASLYGWACTTNAASHEKGTGSVQDTLQGKVHKTEEQWKAQLSPQAYYVLREGGTERPFSGKYAHNKAKGIYVCGGCGNPLFASDTKFESGTGWPSFYAPLTKKSVIEQEDISFGMVRTEVLCARCGGHLGHVFADGPKPTGLRYCMNSVALNFKLQEKNNRP